MIFSSDFLTAATGVSLHVLRLQKEGLVNIIVSAAMNRVILPLVQLLELLELAVDLNAALEHVNVVHAEVRVLHHDLLTCFETLQPRMGHLHQIALHNWMNLLEDRHFLEAPLDRLLCDGNLTGKILARITAHGCQQVVGPVEL